MKKITLLSIIMIIFAAAAFSPVANASISANFLNSQSGRVEQENQILKSTARIMIESWVVRQDESGYDIDYTVGHGTVLQGRYLLTHNHFNVPLSIMQRPGDDQSYAIVYVYNSQGELQHKGPLSDFELARQDTETLVFAHKNEAFFESLGFNSAAFEAWSELSLQAGMDLAQVDWDGQVARVDWVQIKAAILDDGVPRLLLDDAVLPGASGGGIFLQGRHVANNWQLQEKIDGEGNIVEAVTAAALNSPAILTLQ